MRIAFDSEFTGLNQRTTLISLGLISGDGRSFYAEFTDYDKAQVDDWQRENIFPHLWYDHLYEVTPKVDSVYPVHYYMKGTRVQVGARLAEWLAQWETVEMWGDCLAYDWVLFCQLFGGGAECLPRNVYYIPFDLCTLLKLRGYDPDMRREELSGPVIGQRHHALYDAAVIGLCVHKLLESTE